MDITCLSFKSKLSAHVFQTCDLWVDFKLVFFPLLSSVLPPIEYTLVRFTVQSVPYRGSTIYFLLWVTCCRGQSVRNHRSYVTCTSHGSHHLVRRLDGAKYVNETVFVFVNEILRRRVYTDEGLNSLDYITQDWIGLDWIGMYYIDDRLKFIMWYNVI